MNTLHRWLVEQRTMEENRGICYTLFRPALVAGRFATRWLAPAWLARMTARQGDSWKEMLVTRNFAAIPVFFFYY
jgi:hypothetical protein